MWGYFLVIKRYLDLKGHVNRKNHRHNQRFSSKPCFDDDGGNSWRILAGQSAFSTWWETKGKTIQDCWERRWLNLSIVRICWDSQSTWWLMMGTSTFFRVNATPLHVGKSSAVNFSTGLQFPKVSCGRTWFTVAKFQEQYSSRWETSFIWLQPQLLNQWNLWFLGVGWSSGFHG